MLNLDTTDLIQEGNGLVIREGQRLIMDDILSQSGLTVWLKNTICDDFSMEYQARTEDPLLAGNLNVFFCSTTLGGDPVYGENHSGGYQEYHRTCRLYILTHTGVHPHNEKLTGWSRIRKDPGFLMKSEDLALKTEHGRTYSFTISKKSDRITITRDGRVIHDITDPDPLGRGNIGFRTWQSRAVFSDICIKEL